MENFGSRNRRDAITSRFRLRDYDYSTPGLYFVTICTQGRVPLFGHVDDGVMILNDAGWMVSERWSAIRSVFLDVSIEHFVTMPNHIHAITGIGMDAPYASKRTSLPDVMQWYKSTTTNQYIKGVNALRWSRFDGRLWQKGYHDHIVRNERELGRLWSYIDSNPAQWHRDTFFEV